VTGLRRLADLVAAHYLVRDPVTVDQLGGAFQDGRARHPVTADRLREAFRELAGLPADAVVTAADLADLVAMTQEAKDRVRGRRGGTRVTVV